MKTPFALILVVAVACSTYSAASPDAKAKPTVPDLEPYIQRQQIRMGYPPPPQYPLVFDAPQVDRSEPSPETDRMLRYLRDFAEVAYLLEHERFEKARQVLDQLEPRAKRPAPLLLIEARLETELASRETYQARRAKAQRNEEEAQRLEKAAEERLGKVRDLVRIVLERDAKNIEAWLADAQALRLMGKHQELLDLYRQARKQAPKHVDILKALGARLRVEMNLNRDTKQRAELLQELQGVYEDLVEALPGRPSAQFQEVLAILKAGSGDRTGAIEHYKSLVQLQPTTFRYYTQLSRYLKDAGNLQEALQIIRRGMAREPDSPELIGALGYLLRGPDSNAKQREFMADLAKEYPGRDAIQVRYARVLIEQEAIDEAVDVLTRSLDFHPDNDPARKLLMQVCLSQALELSKQDKPTEAASYVETALRFTQASERDLLHKVLVPLYRQTDRRDKALALLDASAADQPDNWRARLILLTQLYTFWGKSDDLDRRLEAVESETAQDPQALFETAILHWEVLGELDVAETRLRRAIELDGGFAEALNSLGYLYAEQGKRLEEAEQLVRQALDINPHAGHILDSLGWVYYKKGENEKAIEYLEKAVKHQPDVPEIEEHLGRAYIKAGREREALEYLRKAMTAMRERPGAETDADFRALRELVDQLERKQAAAAESDAKPAAPATP